MGKVVKLRPDAAGEQIITKDHDAELFVDQPDKLEADIENGAEFAAQHKDKLRWCPELGWLIWDGRRWAEDDSKGARIYEFTEQTVAAIKAAAIAEKDDPIRRKALERRHKQASKHDRQTAMVNQAKHRMIVEAKALDAHPALLNCHNRTVNLLTGKTHQHNPADLITKLAGGPYDRRAKAARWFKYLPEVFGGDHELIGLLRRASGYSATGLTDEECLFILHGDGRNGKGTFINMLIAALGDYALPTRSALILERQRGSDNNMMIARARLKGARFVPMGETSETVRIDETAVKELTGSDPINGRHLYQSEITFKPEFKPWMSTNHRPEITGTDVGIWSRIRLIEFKVRYYNPDDPEDAAALKADPTLPRQDHALKTYLLEHELPGVLAWIIRGAIEWHKRGLGTCCATSAAIAEYKSEMNMLADFIDTWCVRLAGVKTTIDAIYTRYTVWAKDSGRHPWSKMRFVRRMRKAGFRSDDSTRNEKGQRCFEGLKLRDPKEVYCTTPDPEIPAEQPKAAKFRK